MKYKEWLKQARGVQYPYDAIFCPDCGRYIGTQRDYMFVVLMHPIVCPDCDEIVIFRTVTYDCQTGTHETR